MGEDMRRFSYVIAMLAGVAPTPAMAEVLTLDEMTVTANRGGATSLASAVGSVQIIDEDTIANSSASSLTDLLEENAVGFFSQWTGGQTSINIRGVNSDGQGKDFKSGVLVLMNGRRAGTANLSKLSLDQVQRVEIIRGPASVAYGSQAMGGVINILTKSGRTVEGGSASLTVGSFDHRRISAEYGGDFGGVKAYAGASGMHRGDIDAGDNGGKQANTEVNHRGALAAFGFDLPENRALDLTLRTDGVYDTGFPGSSWDIDNVDDRFNQSIDLAFHGGVPVWNADLAAQIYAFRDIDDFRWGSEVGGWDSDSNRRELRAFGMRLTPTFKLAEATSLAVGVDTEYSQLRNSRFRVSNSGSTASQIPPYDNNQDDLLLGTFAELTQGYDEGRGEVRLGGRHTRDQLSLKSTPNLSLSGDTEQTFTGTTYGIGTAYRALPWMKLRTSVATGFRAPTATELAGQFSSVLTPNTITYGNPDLEAENNRQFEVGFTVTPPNAFIDVAVFDNTIEDRISTETLTATTSRYVNSQGDARIRGVEIQTQFDAAPVLGLKGQRLSLTANGAYNFMMKENGAANAKGFGQYRDKVQNMYEYQAAFRATYGWARAWDASLNAVLHGPSYYDTEEWLTTETNRATVQRKDPFWVFGLRANWYAMDGLTVFGGVDNLFDINEHPKFIALSGDGCTGDMSRSNGGCGNSIAGRSFYLGAKATF